MKTKAEVLLDQLEQIAMNQNDLTQPVPFEIGDVVSLKEEETDYVGMIEDVDRGIYQVRVYAIAGDEFEPTDKIYFRYEEELEHYEKTPVVENPEAPDDPKGEDGEFEEGDQVKWNSSVGEVFGKIQELNPCKIEVYAKSGDYLEATGVTVEIDKEHLERAEFEAKVAPHTIMIKMEAKMDIDGNIGRFKGVGSQYGQVDLGGDTVAKGAYKQTLNHKGGKIKLMFDHGWTVKDLAGVAYLTDSDKGLMVDAEMPLDATDVKNDYIKIKFLVDRGEPVGLSIGYDPVKVQHNADGTRTLKEIALHEMSITPFPMDTGAQILYAKSKRIAYKAMQHRWQTIKTDAPFGNQDD